MHNRMLPRVVTSAMLVLGLLAAARGANAQVYFNGFTNGLFCSTISLPSCPAVPPYTSALQTASFATTGSGGHTQRIWYANSKFSGWASNTQPLNLTYSAAPWGTQNVNNFGSFYVPGGGNVTYSSPFTLWVNFLSPQTSTLMFSALVSGTVTNGHGVVSINFNAPTSQNLVLNSGIGYATITLQNAAVDAEGNPTSVTGFISTSVTPEPFTMSLVGTGLLGLAGFARRRRKQNQQLAA